MKMRTLMATLAALLAMNMTGVCGLFGSSTKTETSDSNAKFDLPPYTGLKMAVGCIDFKNEAGWSGAWDLGNNLSIMLESALYDTGRFVLVERDALKDIIAEQDLATSGRTAAASKVAKSGAIRPARYLASGAVTVVEEDQSGSGGGLAIGGIRVGGSKGKSQITIIAKLIDSTTGEIVAKQNITGKAGKVGLSLGVNGSIGGHGFATDMGGFEKTPLAEAAQDCINQAALFFAKQMETLPFEGAVVKVSDSGDVIVNRGSEYGIAVGQEFTMRTPGEALMDPDTGASLGYEEGKVIGSLKVTKVTDKVAYCTVTDGEKNPEKGSVIVKK